MFSPKSSDIVFSPISIDMFHLNLTCVFLCAMCANVPNNPGQSLLESWLPIPVVGVVGSSGTASH